MACNVNTQRTDSSVGTTGVPARIGTSESVDSSKLSSTLYAPQLFSAYSASNWNSLLSVQNTEASALTVYISYKDRYGTAYPAASESATIPAQSSHVFYQGSNTNLPTGFIGSAVITSTGNLAAIANFYNGGADYGNSQLHSYTTFATGASKIFVPRFVRNYHGYNGGLTVQNIGSGSTTVQVTFTFAGNSYVYNSPSIAAGASLVLYGPNIVEINAVDSLTESQRTGSAVVQAGTGGSIVAIVNEDNRGSCNGAVCGSIPSNAIGQGSTYEAFRDGVQTNTMFFIQLTKHVGSQDYSGGIQIGNTTGSAGTCNITYPSYPAANETNVTLPASGQISRFAPDVGSLISPYNGSVKVDCTQPIVGISNLSSRLSSYFGDTMTTAPGMNQ